MAKKGPSRAVRPSHGKEESPPSPQPEGTYVSGPHPDEARGTRPAGEPYNHFAHAVKQALAQATVEEKGQTLLEAMKHPDFGIKRKGLDREALDYYLRVGRTDKAGVSSDQWCIVTDVYSKHVRPYFMTGTQEEREAFAQNLPWLFRPEEIMAYGLSTGCASTAPVFAVLARMAGMRARLAISVLADDFPAACPHPGQPRVPNAQMNGHQIVMVKQDSGRWSALNSSVGSADASRPKRWWTTDLDGNKLEWDRPEGAVDAWVEYPGFSGGYVIRGVESQRYDLLLVRNFNTCKNVQASGSYNIDIVRPLPPRPR